ncbi:hypothetical protein [Actinotalea sp. C106]|uniref:hypothetical protein n=1 Tax=Actinotalea sp. C106 TaxID=2908644 RepID=UPI0020291DD2|nr:hypothetical protein [Actinotalea sp. C106]
MSATEIVQALEGWVERIGSLGAAVVPRLRPGLPPDQIAKIAARHGFVLSEEIAAIWSWHDGERTRTERGTARQLPGLIPQGAFFDVETTLSRGLSQWHTNCGDDDELADPDVSDEDKTYIWRREWVIFDWWLIPLVLATTPDGRTDTFRYDPQSGTNWVAHSSLPERIAWWHRYLDLGAWRVEPDGTWGGDSSRIPQVDRTASKAEQVRQTEVT